MGGRGVSHLPRVRREQACHSARAAPEARAVPRRRYRFRQYEHDDHRAPRPHPRAHAAARGAWRLRLQRRRVQRRHPPRHKTIPAPTRLGGGRRREAEEPPARVRHPRVVVPRPVRRVDTRAARVGRAADVESRKLSAARHLRRRESARQRPVLFVAETCEQLFTEITEYSWDPKKAVDGSADAFRNNHQFSGALRQAMHLTRTMDVSPRVRTHGFGSACSGSCAAPRPPTGIRTLTVPILSRLPLPVGLWGVDPILADAGGRTVPHGRRIDPEPTCAEKSKPRHWAERRGLRSRGVAACARREVPVRAARDASQRGGRRRHQSVTRRRDAGAAARAARSGRRGGDRRTGRRTPP